MFHWSLTFLFLLASALTPEFPLFTLGLDGPLGDGGSDRAFHLLDEFLALLVHLSLVEAAARLLSGGRATVCVHIGLCIAVASRDLFDTMHTITETARRNQTQAQVRVEYARLAVRQAERHLIRQALLLEARRRIRAAAEAANPFRFSASPIRLAAVKTAPKRPPPRRTAVMHTGPPPLIIQFRCAIAHAVRTAAYHYGWAQETRYVLCLFALNRVD